MKLEIVPVDPADQATVDAVLDVRNAARAIDVPDFPPLCRHYFHGALTHQTRHRREEYYLARLGAAPVGYLNLTMPLTDNLDNAELDLLVAPRHRRQGVGRALHRFAVDRLRAAGRKRYATATVDPLPDGPPRDQAGRAFAVAMGAAAALDEVRRRLDLAALDESALSAMVDAAGAKATGYKLVTWRDRTPDEYAADAAYLEGRLLSDAPLGDLAWEPEKIDTDRLREAEEAIAVRGFRVYSTGAVHGESGRLVALTTIGRTRSTPWHAWQWITLVDPDHRGHRLGALVKVENMRHARAHEPELRVIDTWNAAVNQHMISINEQLGFRPVDSWVNWQREV